MRKIAIAAAVSLSLSGVTNLSHALGLGEIEMYSALNQNLDAEIAILSATEGELRDMQVKLASASAFARAGLVQSPVLSTVEFAVDRRPDGKAVVKVTSDGPVLEPFLNFLIEVDAPGSVKLVREYTVLLDPPTFAGNANSASQSDDSFAVAGADVFANNTSNGTGVEIDLTDAIPTTFESTDSFLVNDTGSEVTFTESTVGVFTAPSDTDAEGSQETLFVPDDQVLENVSTTRSVGSSLVDSNGQLISLTQEFSTTPEIDNSNSSGGEIIELTGVGEDVSLDNLGAPGDSPGDSRNAIFSTEFESGQGELISGEELRGLVGDVAPAEPVVAFQETPAELFVPDLFAADTDTDAQGGAGDLIDLSGLVDDSDSFFVQEAVVDNNASTTIELSGNSYQIRTQDTLWSISNAQKAPGVSTHQMMVALTDANPDAFLGGNMNRMRSGAVLQIPTEASQRSVDRASALSIVESWTSGNSTGVRRTVNIIPPTTVYEETNSFVDTDNMGESSNSLDEINLRYEEVSTDIATGTVIRDELRGRVDSLTDNMEEMKTLITVRENELNQLQDEVTAAESNAAAIDEQISLLSNASEGVASVQQELSKELQQAQNAIAMQADADKNLATAEAEAQSIRLSSEEDALRAQLAALELEKRDLEASSQLEKAALVREAEEEKTRLLAEAKAEREKILADLEFEKARISRDAEMEIARIKGETELENQRLLSEAQAERDRVAADAQQMQAQLEQMEAEKAQLLEETQNNAAQIQAESTAAVESAVGSEEPSRVKDRLSQLQEEAGDTASEVKATIANNVNTDGVTLDTDTDAEGVVGDAVNGISDAGKGMAAGGAAAVGGLLGFAPLQEMVGNRKTVLAAGAGLSLLGLLGAWGLRRRKAQPAEVKGVRARGEGRPVVAPKDNTNFAKEEAMYGDSDETYVRPQRRASSSAAAAAAAAAAAVTGTAAAASSRDNKSAEQDKPLSPKAADQAPVAKTEATKPAPEATTAPAPQATAATAKTAEGTASDNTSNIASNTAGDATSAANTSAAMGGQAKDAVSQVDAELEEKALDDTITEAEVYLRYGLHGQAEDLLKTAIERSPNNEEYHFKLLENYHDQKNVDDFNALAEKFTDKFPKSGHKDRIAEMSTELGNKGIGGALAAGAAGAAAMATGAAASVKDAASDGIDTASDGIDSLTATTEDSENDLLDQTIDPGLEFDVDELQATGNLNALIEDDVDLSDQGGMSLDDVDLASLDDDGTMNLEEIAGSQMSGGDLGTLDLTNPDLGGAYDNLSLEDTSLDDVSSDIRQGLETDLPVNNPIAGGTDEMETMLDLAKAYIDMGDTDNASKALKDIAARGNPLQQTEASELLKKLS